MVGLASVAGAGWIAYDAWSTQQAWVSSPEAVALARQAAEPTPIWLPPATPAPISADVAPLPTAQPLAALTVPAAPTPTVIAAAEDLSLDAADFRFLDPPEPGAHARLALTVTNHASATSDRVLLGIPQRWFESYKIIGTAPAVAADRTTDDGVRTFSFPAVVGGATVHFELHVSASAEGTEPPKLSLLLPDGSLIAENEKLSTLAPTPRPGPVMGIEIPRLKLKSSVVQTQWEPPPFVVGQIRGSANITRGNTVLIGHLSGAAGNVFSHLDQLEPGDEVTATSRGLPYSFVVSRVFTSTNKDPSPIAQSDEADQLTLMTCAGLWNPFTHDYSERLWVVAEPPEQAKATIARVSATATAEATASRATTATPPAAEPTLTPTAVPMPYKGEPSTSGGIGNTRVALEKAFGLATGETSGRLVVFRQQGREVHVQFTPDPPRAALVALLLKSPLTFDAAVSESRKLFPSDARPRLAAPEGNTQFVVERFASASLEQALGSGDFSVIYLRDARGAVTTVIFGLGDDLDALIAQSRR